MWLTEIGTVDEVLFYIFAAVSALNVVLAVANNILRCFLHVGVAGSSMDFYLTYGCMILIITILIRGLNINMVGQLDAAFFCQFYPGLLTFGLLCLVGGVLCKVLAIAFVHSFDIDRALRYEWIPNLAMFLLIIIDAIVVLAWVIQSSPELYVSIDGSKAGYLCRGSQNPEFQLGVSAYHAVLLFLAALFVVPAVLRSRRTSTQTESRLMLVIVSTLVIVVFVGTILFVLVNMTSSAQYAMVSGLMEFAIFVTLLCILIGKVLLAREERTGRREEGEVYDEVDDKGSSSRHNQNGSEGEDFTY